MPHPNSVILTLSVVEWGRRSRRTCRTSNPSHTASALSTPTPEAA